MNIHVRGPVNGPTGYEECCRGLLRALYLQGHSVHLEPLAGWGRYEIQRSDLTNKSLAVQISNQIPTSSPMLHFCLPEQTQERPGGVNLNYTMFEVSRIPRQWVEAAKRVDYILLPSKHCMRVWQEGGVSPDKLVHIGLGIDTEAHIPGVEPMGLMIGDKQISDYDLRCVVVQEITPRKNLEGAISAFVSAHKALLAAGRTSCLVLKLSSYSNLTLVRDRVRSIIGQQSLPIFVYDDILSEEQMPHFLAAFSCYLSMSYGEGADLTAMKMTAMGRIVIVPQHTGYLEYADPNTMIPIEREEAAVAPEGLERLYEDAKWCVPSVRRASDLLYVAGTQTEECLEFAGRWADRQREKLSIDAMATELALFVNSLGSVRRNTRTIYTSKDPNRRIRANMICPTITSDKCGIGDYTRSLIKCLSDDDNLHLGICVGSPTEYVEDIFNHHSEIVHFQHEYQFWSPERLEYVVGRIHSSGGKVVVTPHTFNPNAHSHNKVIQETADAIVWTTRRAGDAFEANYSTYGRSMSWRIPIGCHPLYTGPVADRKSVGLKEGRPVVAVFGFTYPHKGIRETILAVKNMEDVQLLIVSSLPKQAPAAYYLQCLDMIEHSNMRDRCAWVDQWRAEDECLSYLAMADLIVLPYIDYGGFGSSAAARTCLRVNKPMLVTNTPFLSDLIDDEIAYGMSEIEELDYYIEECLRSEHTNILERSKEYVSRNSWQEVSSSHVKLYKQLAGRI